MPTELRFNRNYIIYYHNWTMITLTGRQKQELKVVGILIKALYYTYNWPGFEILDRVGRHLTFGDF